MLRKNTKIFVSGHNGLVGSAVIRRLINKGFKNLLTVSKRNLDLRDQKKVFSFFKKEKIEAVINTAATVGGILANDKFSETNGVFNNIFAS